VRGGVPIIVVMRHVSSNDVVLSPFVFGWRLGFNLRVVMKKELLWDPFIEAAGTRCDNFFIDRWNKSDMDLEVQGVSQLMAPPYQDADGRYKVSGRQQQRIMRSLLLDRVSPSIPRGRG
jgi:1-acyl-sn-glycerol-3-phosphate acyltransferase